MMYNLMYRFKGPMFMIGRLGMAQMVRKQIYIEEQQERGLKLRARLLGVSEAELIRRALDGERGQSLSLAPDPQAWEDARATMLALGARTGELREPIRWSRDELYRDRMVDAAPGLD
jgi:hypothetical protein